MRKIETWDVCYFLLCFFSLLKLLVSFFLSLTLSLLPLGWKKQVSILQLALTFLISLPTLSLSTGLLLEPPSLATGFAIILNTVAEDLEKIECPHLGIPSPSPTSIQGQNMWSASLRLMAERKVPPWLASNQQVTCFLVFKGLSNAGDVFCEIALCCLSHHLKKEKSPQTILKKILFSIPRNFSPDLGIYAF